MNPKNIKISSVISKDIRPYLGQFIVIIFIGVISGLAKSSVSKFTEFLFGLWENKYSEIAIREKAPYLFDIFSLSLIYQIPIVITIAYILANITRFFVLSRTKIISEKICNGLRTKILHQYLNSSLSYLEHFKSGSGGLISRMLGDINYVQGSYYRIGELLKEPIVVLFSLGYLFWTDYKLTASLFLVLPLVTLVITSTSRSLKRNSRRNQENLEEISSTLKESLDGSRVIRSFNLESKIKSRFEEQISKFFKYRKKIIILEELNGPVSESLTTILLAGIFIFVGLQIQDAKMSVSEFLGYGVALALLLDSAKKTQDAFIRLQQGLVARTRMEELLTGEDQFLIDTGTKTFPKTWDQIEFKNLNYTIGHRQILKNINLTIQKGETVALVGPSGSGKTSLLNLLEKFVNPTSGSILIGDTSLSEMSSYELRQNVALVSQDVFLFRDSIEENIKAALVDANFTDIEAAAKAANIANLVETLPEKYKTSVGDRGQRLSGGEKQRISIARAFLKNAPILLLDEATSALDTESEFEVQKGLQTLMQGKTCLVVAHRLSTIRNANRIIVIKNGEIVQIGSHNDLANKPGEYQRLLELS